MKKVIHLSGKRKRAIARATLKEGKGIIRINGRSIDCFEPEFAKQKIMEPILLAGGNLSNFDINVKIIGGGVTSQADAARLAIAKTLVENNQSLKKVFLDYDRTLLVADVRRKECAKPNRHGQARSKTQKSYR